MYLYAGSTGLLHMYAVPSTSGMPGYLWPCHVSSVGSLDTLHDTDDVTYTTRCLYLRYSWRYCMRTDVSGVGSLDTLHATDGLVDTIPDTSRCMYYRILCYDTPSGGRYT